MPLDFVYKKSTNKYMLELYESDQELLEKVQTGRGDLEIYEQEQRFLYIEGIFAGIEPSQFYQRTQPNPNRPDEYAGVNDLEKAKVAQYSYYID